MEITERAGRFGAVAETDNDFSEYVSKVPQVTLVFWIIKVLATTLGETGGDAVSMSMNLGYLVSTVIFGVIFAAAVAAQIKASKYHPFLYWLTIVATTTVGTTLADFADRSLGIGYTGGASILLVCVVGSLLVWKWSMGTVSVMSNTKIICRGGRLSSRSTLKCVLSSACGLSPAETAT